jgi:hypothetical protein
MCVCIAYSWTLSTRGKKKKNRTQYETIAAVAASVTRVTVRRRRLTYASLCAFEIIV